MSKTAAGGRAGIGRFFVHNGSFLWRFLCFAAPFWGAERRWINRARLAAVVLLTVAQVAVQAGLNFWSARLYNALEQRALDRFLGQIVTFACLLAAAMAVFTLSLRVRRRLQFAWRVHISRRILDRWMESGRHYQLTLIPGEHDNPDGRIAEDIRVTTESAIDLGQSLLYCILLLFTFVDVLWTLSGTVHVPVGGTTFAVPGHLVFIALTYATIGTSMALWVGRPLVSASNLRQSVEADFRFGLARTREYSEAIALIGGDADERFRLLDLLRDVRRGWDRQTAGLTRIILFTSAYSILASPFPILIAAPRYILGLITLGTLMQTAQAFQQVTAALSWPVDNLATIAQWRASVERVLALRDALETLDEKLGEGRIAHRQDGPVLRLNGLQVTHHHGVPVMQALTAEVAPGERVRIDGDPDITRRVMLAVAGLWPWGAGEVCLPAAARIFVATDRPYLPIGPLAGVVCYPSHAGACRQEDIATALRRAGLPQLAANLDEQENWEQVLSLPQQQRLSFARILLHKPDWIFLAEATNALDDTGQHDIARILQQDCAGAAILASGHDGVRNGFFQRVVKVVAV